MRRRRIVTAAVLAAAVLALAVLSVPLLGSSLSPLACGSCHSMRPLVDSAQTSAHSDVRCYSCHEVSSIEAVVAWGSALPSMVIAEAGQGDSRPAASVPDASCVRCHPDPPTSSRASDIRFDHGTCGAREIGCSQCHTDVAHGENARSFAAFSMDRCMRCHTDRGAPVACDTCHPERRSEARLERGPWRLTHGPQWKQTHGAGDLETCATCHESPKWCAQCHGLSLPHEGDFGSNHGALARSASAQCFDCHEQPFCDECHQGLEMPHTAAFLPQHGKVAQRDHQNPRCLTCHVPENCDACHVRHIHPGGTKGSLQGATLPSVESTSR